MEKHPARILRKQAISEGSGELATSGRPSPASTIPALLGRREVLRAGLTSSLSLWTGLTMGGKPSLASPPVQESEKRTPQHCVIDAHCHPRWIGYDGARMIENMDAVGIERAWLLSWELPESEMDTAYYSTTDPTGVGIGFRDVIDVAERYPGRFIPGTTVDPHDPHAHEKLKAAVTIFRVRVFGEFKRRLRYDDPDAIRLFQYCGE